MSALLRCGWEAQRAQAEPYKAGAQIAAPTITGSPTYDTTNKRSGDASLSAGPSADNSHQFPVTTTLGRTYYEAVALYVSATSATGANGFIHGIRHSGTEIVAWTLKTAGGGISLWNNIAGADVGGVSWTGASANTWYIFEVKIMVPAAGTNGLVAWRISDTNGNLIQEVTDQTMNTGNTAIASLKCGNLTSIQTGATVKTDDLGLNDDQGSVNNTWIGPERIVILDPTSDGAGSSANWTNPTGTTANRFQAVDNQPPTGVADQTTTNGAQIRNAVSGTAGYEASCQSLSDKGIGSTDVFVLMGFTRYGSGSQVPTMTMRQATPDSGSDLTITAVAAGTDPTGWNTAVQQIEGPLDRTINPIVRVSKTAANTRVALADQMGVQVSHRQVTRLPPRRARLLQAVQRGVSW